MAKFVFEAKAANGKMFRGEVEANNEGEARVKLRAQKLIPTRLSVKGGAAPRAGAGARSSGVRVRAKELQVFTRQFATLLSSGIPVVQSLEVLARGTRNVGFGNALTEIVQAIGAGRRLGDALAPYPKIFDNFFVNMVRAGEEGGVLDTVLNRLAQYMEKSGKIVAKIKGAMVYPAAIIIVAFLVITCIMVFVIPKFEQMFESMNQELPTLTQYVVETSRIFSDYWYLIIGGFAGLIFGIVYYYGTPDGKSSIDGILVDLPLIGDVIQKGAIARFSRTLSTLMGAGVGIMDSMNISAKVAGNHVIEQCFMRAKNAIEQGRSMTTTLGKEKYIPGMVTQMIGVGEQTGALDTMLAKVADFYEDEVDAAIGVLTSAMEPILMVVLGGIIAVLVIAMYLPIFNMAGAVSGV